MQHSDRATPEGTNRYKDRFAELDPTHFRASGDLVVSSIGLGTYLGEADARTDELYRAAVVYAGARGINLIDSAINYRFQRSERAIGRALADLFASGAAARDEIVVCTKGGYLSFDGEPPRDPRAWVERTFVVPGLIAWSDIVSHNVMQPRYIEHELETSRHNLGLKTIDVYYLHNPESQLEARTRREFIGQMSACFEALERAIDEGKIGVYGAATWNGFRARPDEPAYLGLEELTATARAVAGDRHHFRAVQLPINLAMPEAVTAKNQSVAGEVVTLVEAAARLGVRVFASASLLQARLAELPPAVSSRFGGHLTGAQAALQFVRSAPGVSTALVGMSDPAHVDENLDLARRPALDAAAFKALFT